MIYVATVAMIGSMAWFLHVLHIRYRARLAKEYLDGFRDGQIAEARINQATAPKITTVAESLMGRN